MTFLTGLRQRVLLAASAALLLVGCGGSKGVKIEGKIVRNGAPLKVEGNDILGLSFDGPESKVFPATVNKDGTFVANGVAPGHYKIRLTLAPGGNDAASLAKARDISKQFDAVNNKLEYEVGSGDQTITVDVEKGTVTK